MILTDHSDPALAFQGALRMALMQRAWILGGGLGEDEQIVDYRGVASSGSALAIALLPTRAVSAIRIADTA